MTTAPPIGIVYLVGAGPGDPELLTLRAHRLLQRCDALVHDSLVPLELLELVPATCVVHCVGKRRGFHSVPQPSTNALMVQLAATHRCVVRLKGGDPFLFGRGAEEAAYLVSKGVPVEVVPMEELEAVLETSSNGTVVTSRYFLQQVEEIAKRHGVRAVAVDLNDFRHELDLLKELRTGSCVGLVSISPGILRAAEVILHSMRGNELLVMTATPDVGSRLLALLRASSHVLCDRPSLPLVEQSLRQNRSQLMRLPQVHCAKSYLGAATIDLLRKEIGLQSAA